MRYKSNNKRGFTLVEVAVAAVLVGILAAATIPSLHEFLDGQDATATATTLSTIAAGIAQYEKVVLANTTGSNVYPGNISYLTNAITTASLNSCGAAYSTTSGGAANLVTNWNTNSPFVNFYIPPGGFQTPVGVIQDQLVRLPAPGTTAVVGQLAIVMTAISQDDAMRLERIIDGDDGTIAANQTSGTFRITALNGTGSQTRTASVQYLLPAAARC